MKKTLFAIVSLAVLAMGCVKEQQPSETPADSKGVSTIRISMAPTKVSVDETTGACAWQDGDQIAVWFANTDATAGQRVVYTFKTVLSDGSAEFETSETITEGYAPAKVTYPAECLNDEGGWGLIRDWEYKEGFIPMYARTETITVNDDGSLSAQLYHNASVFKFTLHDIPAYAAGFVLEAVKYNKNEAGEFVDADGNVIDKENATPSQTIAIKTSFPYKTGYTADPADNSNDIKLYSVAAHGSYLTRVYLVDGNGDEIEGSVRKIKQSWNDVSTDDFIEFPRIDFKKSELRKDYIMLWGVKWAKGNLRYDANVTADGFQTGWSLTADQWDYIGYDVASSVVDDVEYKYDDEKAIATRLACTSSRYEHFNWGGIGKWSFDITNYLKASPADQEKCISGKIYSDQGGTVEVSGDARFASEGDSAPALYGDLAFWASKGKYRVPSYDDMTSIHNKVSKIPGWYVSNGFKVWGYLLRNPELGYDRNSDAAANGNREFSAADLETGMFLPCGGRKAESNADVIINQRTQLAYWSSLYKKQNNNRTRYYSVYYSNSPAIKRIDSWDGSKPNNNAAWSCACGFMIRPVLAE